MLLGIAVAGFGAILLAIAIARGKAQAGTAEIQPEVITPVEPVKPATYGTSFDARVQAFAEAIASAEGFGVGGAIPTIYHNPGDLKPPTGEAGYWQGQIGVGRGGHAIFDSDTSGWNALRKQVRLWATNKSHVAGTGDTFASLAKKYAEDSAPWLANVTGFLGVNPTLTLGEFFNG